MSEPGTTRRPEERPHTLPAVLRGGPTNSWSGVGQAWGAVSTLISGIAVWGAIGFGLDHLLGTRPVLFVVGVLLGNFGGIYLMYVKYVRNAEGPHAT